MAGNLIIGIILKYARQEELDAEEYSMLQKWHAQWGGGRPLSDLIHDQEWLRISLYWQHGLPSRSDWRELKRLIAATGDPLPVSRIDTRWVTGGIAAAALILVAVIAYFASPSGTGTSTSGSMARVTRANHTPAQDGQAELTCQDGRKIAVDSAIDDGIVAEEGNVTLRRVNRHTLQYEVEPDKPATAMIHFFYAGMTGSYKLLFPDGSWVQLEKGASLRYSPALRGTGQPAILSGGAWFSIAKNSKAPLSVMANGATVDVLGTEFHVSSASGDKETKVCVYHGAVRVQQGPKSVTLRDSDEVTVREQELQPKKKVSDFDALLAGTDIDQRFHFDNCSLAEAVQQIADHYHTDVRNPTRTQGIPIKGDPARSLPLKALLKDIELIENGNAYLGLSNKTILISAAPIK